MCGIAGIINTEKFVVSLDRLKQMTDVIAYRGPDGEGQWINAKGNVALGHRRLSIIDISVDGAQPMHYENGHYAIVFNGEIYNYVELREQCIKKGYQFHSHTDTEVIMAMYDWHGKNCLQYFDGMFSFALYDAQTQKLFCARDRFGEKPFFYSYLKGEHFVFGSEMKCLWKAGIPKEVNRRMEYNYLNWGYLENPEDLSETFFSNCTRLPHAHYLILDCNTCIIEKQEAYYNMQSTQNSTLTKKQAVENFRELMLTSVRRRMRSDVAVGSSLSGGLDSSVIVSIISTLLSESSVSPNTFSAVFPGWKKDERSFIDLILARNNVNAHFTTPTGEGLARDFLQMSWHQEEPFGSASIYAQYCVMQLARANNVTVLLDGQGADEILAGYPGYFAIYFQELRRKQPKQYRNELEIYQNRYGQACSFYYKPHSLRNRIDTVAPGLRKQIQRIKHNVSPPLNTNLSVDYLKSFRKEDWFLQAANEENLHDVLYQDTFTKGPLQQLLRYADRNSMAHSREVRLPFLSHELVDFVFSLPADYKLYEGWTKWLLRESFSEMLPPEIAWRKEKVGFEPPQNDWLATKFMQECIQESRAFAEKSKYVKAGVSNSTTLSWRLLQIHSLNNEFTQISESY